MNERLFLKRRLRGASAVHRQVASGKRTGYGERANVEICHGELSDGFDIDGRVFFFGDGSDGIGEFFAAPYVNRKGLDDAWLLNASLFYCLRKVLLVKRRAFYVVKNDSFLDMLIL